MKLIIATIVGVMAAVLHVSFVRGDSAESRARAAIALASVSVSQTTTTFYLVVDGDRWAVSETKKPGYLAHPYEAREEAQKEADRLNAKADAAKKPAAKSDCSRNCTCGCAETGVCDCDGAAGKRKITVAGEADCADCQQCVSCRPARATASPAPVASFYLSAPSEGTRTFAPPAPTYAPAQPAVTYQACQTCQPAPTYYTQPAYYQPTYQTYQPAYTQPAYSQPARGRLFSRRSGGGGCASGSCGR